MTAMPELLQELLRLDYDYDDGKGIDFEPYDAFMPHDEARDWLRAWTGNPDADADPFLVFGQDGSGGYAALWQVRPGAPLLDQPVVFLGSEGELGVVASSVHDYLWVLAGNVGPYEAVEGWDERPTNAQFANFARLHAAGRERTARAVIAAAQAEFPDFEQGVRDLCR